MTEQLILEPDVGSTAEGEFERHATAVVPLLGQAQFRSYATAGQWFVAVLADPELTDTAKLAAGWLAARRKETKTSGITATVSTIAAAVGSSDRAVEKGLQQLVTMGWVKSSGTRGRNANTYILPIPESSDANPEDNADTNPEKEDDGRFSWDDFEDISVPQQDAIAIYINPNDDIVIRQNSYSYVDDDMIIIRKQNVQAVIDKLTELHRYIQDTTA